MTVLRSGPGLSYGEDTRVLWGRDAVSYGEDPGPLSTTLCSLLSAFYSPL